MQIDIRESVSEDIDSIKFGNFGWLDIIDDRQIININNKDNASYKLWADKSDIDNLIKALQKAKELWCE